jgi:hypothetical protein
MCGRRWTSLDVDRWQAFGAALAPNSGGATTSMLVVEKPC